MQDFEDIAVITFDAGGTLITPHPSVGAIYAEILSKYGITVSPSTLDRLFKKAYYQAHDRVREKVDEASEKEFWRDIVHQTIRAFCPADEFEPVFEDFFKTFASAKRWQTTDGAVATLKSLKERGYRLAILSNADSRFRRVFAELGIDTLVETLFISTEIGVEKPDRRIFLHVQNSFEVPPHQMLHIGDSPFYDGDGAAGAGWNYFIVGENPGHTPASQTIDRLSDLLTRLPRISKLASQES